MGAYLTSPVTETICDDRESSKLRYGSGSMQGWRVSQEDAHCAIIDYDDDTELFAVFDGHGGAEVALYSAQNLHKVIKSQVEYKSGNYSKALEDAFLEFDASLMTPEVLKELKILASNDDMDDDDEEDKDEAHMLRIEANMPIEDLLTRYNSGVKQNKESESETSLCSSSSSSSNTKAKLFPPHLRHELLTKDKPLSPYLRAPKQYTNANPPDDEIGIVTGLCSSSSSKSKCTSSAEIEDNVSNGEIKSNAHVPDSTIKNDSEDTDKSVESNIQSNEIEMSSVSNGDTSSSADERVPTTTTSSDCQPSSSLNEASSNDNLITSNTIEVSAESSSNLKSDAPESSTKGKGKQKKIMRPKRKAPVEGDSTGPIYEAFLKDFDDDSEDDEDDSNDDYDAKLPDSDDEEDDVEDEEDEETESESSDSEDEEDEVDANEFILGASGGYEDPGRDSGCTAVVALLRGDCLYVANAGDSRCVVSRNGKAIEMSFDHKPEDDPERKRIMKAGGRVTPDGRVNGGLNLSRAIGDHAYKDNTELSPREQMITALPDIKTLNLDHEKDEFMVLACDGIWNSYTSQQVIDYVRERLNTTEKLSSICEDLFRKCLAPNTHGDGTGCDNMTCIVVKFKNNSLKRKTHSEDENEAECVPENADLSNDGPAPKRIKTDIEEDADESSSHNCSTTV